MVVEQHSVRQKADPISQSALPRWQRGMVYLYASANKPKRTNCFAAVARGAQPLSRGSTPLMRTLPRRPNMGKKDCHVKRRTYNEDFKRESVELPVSTAAPSVRSAGRSVSAQTLWAGAARAGHEHEQGLVRFRRAEGPRADGAESRTGAGEEGMRFFRDAAVFFGRQSS